MTEIKDIDSGMDIFLPPSLAGQYTPLSCLKYSEQGTTCLLRENDSGRIVLMKTAYEPFTEKSLLNESQILKQIHQQHADPSDTFPFPIALEHHEGVCYYLRTYIEGHTLEELCESNYRKPGLSVRNALDYTIQLTELLSFLHTMTPPLIHRDIKPQNIIIDCEGSCHFIDLGISRFYEKHKHGDTMIMGTRLTAPPEQFGYQQTDIRSDLYSVGIVLLYCLTGEYKLENCSLSELDPNICRIIRKAIMFDPDKRYQTSAQLLSDLLEVRFQNLPLPSPLQKNAFAKKLCVILSLVCLILCVLLARQQHLLQDARSIYANPTSGTVSDSTDEADVPANPFYTFREPLIEEAVRTILHKPDGAVTKQDLAKITELHIMGLQIFSDDSEIWFLGDYPYYRDDAGRETGLYLQPGSISSLEDITHMPNLSCLSLYGQQISDLSLLAGTEIRELGIGYNPVTDLTPLRENTSLEYLNLAALEIQNTDLAALASLENLRRLNLSSTGITVIAGLENCALEELSLYGTNLNDYRELQKLIGLKTLTLGYLDRQVTDCIAGMGLQNLSFHYSQDYSFDLLNVLPDLETLYFSGDGASEVSFGNPNLPNLKNLTLYDLKTADFSPLSTLPSLEILQLYGADCQSYDGLDQIPNLHFLNCTDAQKEAIKKEYPENPFLFQIPQ